MNFIKKCYCRTYQAAFRLALPFLPYRKPVLISAVRRIPELLNRHGCRRVLIITDASLVRLGLIRPLQYALAEHGISWAVYDQTMSNPTSANVEDAKTIYLEQYCDSIIGFGGGSSIDCAKAVGVRLARPRRPLKTLKGVLKVRRKLPLLIAVPTTAGTGSEVTVSAVITDSVTRHKYAINDFPLIPRYAVLDPGLTASLPPLLTAATGLDALTHAVEAYIGRTTTRDTRKAALRAVRLIFSSLEDAYRDGTNLAARKNMLMASYYAGCAFTKSYVGYVHAIAHSLGGWYQVPHGLANAILLPHVLEAYGKTIHKKLKALAVAAGIADRNTDAKEAASRFIQAIRDMKIRFQIPDTIPEIQEKDIPRLARYADQEANPLYPVPVLMDAKKLEEFYYQVIEKLPF